MSEFPAGEERLVKQLISTYRCSVCRQGFERERIRVAARQDDLWIVSVRCIRCRKQQIFCIVPKTGGDDEVLRDVSAAEEERFGSMEPVSSDEVLDVHEFLRDFSGDFKRLFGR